MLILFKTISDPIIRKQDSANITNSQLTKINRDDYVWVDWTAFKVYGLYTDYVSLVSFLVKFNIESVWGYIGGQFTLAIFPRKNQYTPIVRSKLSYKNSRFGSWSQTSYPVNERLLWYINRLNQLSTEAIVYLLKLNHLSLNLTD